MRSVKNWYILVINDNLLILSEEIIWQKGKSIIIHNKLVSKKLWKELIIDIDILQRC